MIDRHSSLWPGTKRRLLEIIELHRDMLEHDGSEIGTAQLRGRILALRNFISEVEPPVQPAAPADESSGSLY